MRYFFLVIFILLAAGLYGCKAPGCTDLSWGETSLTENDDISLKYSAGSKCGNYSDYYDEDIDGVISTIKKMKFTLSGICTIYNPEIVDGEQWEEIECPDFVPRTIEFAELTGCKFSTPPSEREDCSIGLARLSFSTNLPEYDTANWFFESSDDLRLFNDSSFPDGTMINNMSLKNDEIYMRGNFVNEKLTGFGMKAEWTETVDGAQVEKEMIFAYSVEIKE